MVAVPHDDTALLQRWQDGDQRAGMTFFNTYYPPILRFFRNKVDVATCDDLVQQTFMAASQAHFAGKSKIVTWLCGIAWRKLSDHYRAEARRVRIEISDFSAFSVHQIMDMGQSPHSQIEKRLESRALLEGLRRLPLNMQAALELHYWEQMSATQISVILDTPLGTIKSRIRYGRIRLAKELEAIIANKEVLQTTLDDLDGWATRVRAVIDTE